MLPRVTAAHVKLASLPSLHSFAEALDPCMHAHLLNTLIIKACTRMLQVFCQREVEHFGLVQGMC